MGIIEIKAKHMNIFCNPVLHKKELQPTLKKIERKLTIISPIMTKIEVHSLNFLYNADKIYAIDIFADQFVITKHIIDLNSL